MAEKHEGMNHEPVVSSGSKFIEGWHGGRIPLFASHGDADVHSVQSGGWFSPETWGGKVPLNTDRVCICAGHKVSAGQDIECRVLAVEGGLDFADLATTLSVWTLQVLAGGYLNMETQRKTPLVCIFFPPSAAERAADPDEWGGGLLVLGKWIADGTGDNIFFSSGSPSVYRAHGAALMNAQVLVNGVGFFDMGRTTVAPTGPDNRAGRYPFHFHHLSTKGNVFENCRVQDSPSWGLSIHSSHGNIIRNNTFVRCAGAGVVTEAGNEKDNLIENNIIEDTIGGGSVEEGKDGAGIWLRSQDNIVQGNRSVRCVKGFAFWRPELDPVPASTGVFKNNISDTCQMVADIRGTSTPIENLVGIDCLQGVDFNYIADNLPVTGLQIKGRGASGSVGVRDRGQFLLRGFVIEGYDVGIYSASPWAINRQMRHFSGVIKGATRASVVHVCQTHYRYTNSRTEYISLLSEPAPGGAHVELVYGTDGNSARPFNYLLKDEFYLLGFQKQPGNNLRLWYPCQQGERVVDAPLVLGTSPEQVGIDVRTGITQHELWQQYGVAICGQVETPGISGRDGFSCSGDLTRPGDRTGVEDIVGEPPLLAPDPVYDGFIAVVRNGRIIGQVKEMTGQRPRAMFWIARYDEPTKEFWWNAWTGPWGSNPDGSFDIPFPTIFGLTGAVHLRIICPGVHHQQPVGIPHTAYGAESDKPAGLAFQKGFLSSTYKPGDKPVYVARTGDRVQLVMDGSIYQRMAQAGQIQGISLAGYVSMEPRVGYVPLYVINEGGNTFTFTTETQFWGTPPIAGYIPQTPEPVEPEEPEVPKPDDVKDLKIMELQQAVAELETAKANLLSAVEEERSKAETLRQQAAVATESLAGVEAALAQAEREREEAEASATEANEAATVALRERADALAQKDTLVQVAESAVSVLSKVLAEMGE